MNQIKKIIIEGKKVHNVGYRPFLLRKARNLGIRNYDADNLIEEGQQKIMISFKGDENQLKEFEEFVRMNHPPNAKVSDVRDVEPPDQVMSIDEYDKVLAAEQQNKIVQTGLSMLGKQDQMLDKQDQTIEVLGDKIDHGFEKMNQNFNKMDVKYDKVSDKMDSIDNTLKELTKAILKLAEKTEK